MKPSAITVDELADSELVTVNRLTNGHTVFVILFSRDLVDLYRAGYFFIEDVITGERIPKHEFGTHQAIHIVRDFEVLWHHKFSERYYPGETYHTEGVNQISKFWRICIEMGHTKNADF
jgi:hypothetical protein